MHLFSARRDHGTPAHDSERPEYPGTRWDRIEAEPFDMTSSRSRHGRRIVRRRKSAIRREGSDIPERFICPGFFEASASGGRSAGRGVAERGRVDEAGAFQRPRIRPDGHGQSDAPGKAAKCRLRRPGILGVALVVFGFVVYFTWAHAPGTDWFETARQSLRGLISV